MRNWTNLRAGLRCKTDEQRGGGPVQMQELRVRSSK